MIKAANPGPGNTTKAELRQLMVNPATYPHGPRTTSLGKRIIVKNINKIVKRTNNPNLGMSGNCSPRRARFSLEEVPS
jgi:hypothetical protein